jgi:Uma2 family endonuclease
MGLVHVKPRLFTREEYYRMYAEGIIGPRERVELIEGAIVPMPPQEKPHADAITRGTMSLTEAFRQTHLVRVQLPLCLGHSSDPEPDFALVPSGALDGSTSHPVSADLIIEVSWSTLSYDRGEKASLYARYGIKDYWIVDKVHEHLEVLRDPHPDPKGPFGFKYRTKTVLKASATVSPLFAPQIILAVSSLL